MNKYINSSRAVSKQQQQKDRKKINVYDMMRRTAEREL